MPFAKIAAALGVPQATLFSGDGHDAHELVQGANISHKPHTIASYRSS